LDAYQKASPGTRVAVNQFDSLDAVRAWRNSDQFKEARRVGDKYATFRAVALDGLPQ
jgi:heme-degrading monooxygenase HmoA